MLSVARAQRLKAFQGSAGAVVRGAAAKIDCHIHSKYSPDGKGSLHELVAVAKEKRLTGICITDHNSLAMWKDIKAAKDTGILVVQGMEVSTRQGHCLALGVRAEIPRDLPLIETLERIEDAGGVGVPSHPFRRVHGVGEMGVLGALKGLAAIETYNARDGKKSSNKRALQLADLNKLGGTGGSDSHQVFEVGNAYAVFRQPVEDVDDLLDQVGKGKTFGDGTPTPKLRLYRQNVKNAWLWARRGFRSI